MEKEFSFSFHDTQKGIRYLASFSLPNSLTLKQAINSQDGEDSFDIFNPLYDPQGNYLELIDVTDRQWDVFCKNATFEDILSGYDNEQDSWLLAPSNWNSDKDFLENIAKQPDLLSDPTAGEKLINILKTARDGSLEIKFYLAPIHPGGKRNVAQIKYIWPLVKELATFLSTKCKNYLNRDLGYDSYDINLGWLDPDESTYGAVVKWAATKGEPRIAFMPPKDLLLLITKPARFADQVVERATGVSQRTRKRQSRS